MYKNNNSLFFSCKYHIVWCTKYRKQILHHPVDSYLKEIRYSVSQELYSNIIKLEVMLGQLYLLIESKVRRYRRF